MGTEQITWTNDRRRLRDLVPWGANPRDIGDDDAVRLADSLEQFGQVQAIAIGPDNEIYDGHQRQKVWAAVDKFGPDYEVDVRVSSRPLDETERQKLAVLLHEGAVGSWDFDIMADWGLEIGTLGEWGLDVERWADELGPGDVPEVDFKEYDESVADEVEYLECPECGHKWPK